MLSADIRKLEFVRVKLVKEQEFPYAGALDSPESIAEAFGNLLGEADREMFLTLSLDVRRHPLNATVASIGLLNCSLANGRELFKSAILSNAANLVLLHNHPSGNVTPSKEDDTVTKRMLQAGEILGIPVLDHIILGGGTRTFYSYKAQGRLDQLEKKAKQELTGTQKQNLQGTTKGKRRQLR